MNRFLLVFCAFVLGESLLAQADQAIQPVAPAPAYNYYIATARPAEQIKQDYPFDISVRNIQGDTLLSTNILEKNGKPTILMFWMTTCMPCQMELKAISDKFDGWKQSADFNFYAISVDFPRNYEQFVKRVDERKWPFPAYYDLNREFQYVMPGGLNGLPQVFVLDKNGAIVYHTRKYRPGDEDILFEKIKSF